MSRRYRPKEVTVKRRKKWALPLYGLALALALAVTAYFVAPLLVDLLEGQSGKLEGQFETLRDDYGENFPEYVFAFMLWLLALALLALVTSATIGKDPDKEAFEYMGAPPADRKQQIKQLRRELKVAKRREKQRKR